MNNFEFASLISDVYKKSFVNIMNNYQCEAHECDDDRGHMEFYSCATVDAGAKDFEMCISIKMPYSTLEKSIPLDPHDGLIDEGELEDWLCELSNLLVGAVKAELLHHNCRLQIGLPQCTHDEELTDILPDDYEHSKYSFTVAHDYCESIVSLQFLQDQVDCLKKNVEGGKTIRSELELF